MEQAKWTNNNHTKGQSSSKEGDVVYMVELEESQSSIIKLLLENQMVNSNKNCSQVGQMKAALSENHLELVNRKCITFHQDNVQPHFFDDQAKTVIAWLGSSDSSTVFTRHCTFGCPFILVFTEFS